MSCIVKEFKVLARAYTMYKATLRSHASRNLKKRIWKSTMASKSMSDMIELVRERVYEHEHAHAQHDATSLLMAFRICIGELGALITQGSIDEAMYLVIDPRAYFETLEAEAEAEA